MIDFSIVPLQNYINPNPRFVPRYGIHDDGSMEIKFSETNSQIPTQEVMLFPSRGIKGLFTLTKKLLSITFPPQSQLACQVDNYDDDNLSPLSIHATYDSEADASMIRFIDKSEYKKRQFKNNMEWGPYQIIIDLDKKGYAMGVEILYVSKLI